ncbi:MAG TPA: imidazolonepropionase, partial [Burkholderiales bacterium]|nr:imidazolonepropionase [Burkholderiales bacterium]
LVDCHTHLVYGGNRANEFEMRLGGATYEDIARAGGGIVSTVRKTRAASDAELTTTATARLERLTAEGVTTIEIKSGYGLDMSTEIRMLRVARALGETVPVTVKTTFLGAHAVPEEYKGCPDAYIDFVAGEVLPEAARAGLIDAVDAFCEVIGFTPAQTMRVFDAAKSHGLPVKLHADQRSDFGGAALAARYGALSADHIEFSGEAGIAAMGAAGTIGVLLPGAYYFLREKQLPPVEALRRHGVPIAIATDSNPGSSPLLSILMAMNFACTLFRLTPEEALAGITRNGAKALGMGATHGTIEVGKVADLAFWKVDSPGELAYAMGANPCVRVVKGGRAI